ncbi:PAAF1 factor, partial [Pygoscelis papua]
KSILISCPHENVSTKFLAPYTTFCRIHQKSITCLDISSGGGLGVSTSTDGTMKIWQAANGEIRVRASSFDVVCYALSICLPCCLSERGFCFDAGILDTAIVDRGRNVLSCSRDGTVRLWDCGKSACLGVIADCSSPVNGIALGTADSSLNLGTPEKAPSEREVGTEGKILLLAREDKKLQGVGLQSRQPVFLFVGSDAFNCCTFLSSTYILAGAQDGNIYQLDVRNTNAPIQVIHRSGAPVLSLLPYRDGFIASQGDGTCFIVQQDLDYVLDLTEADCDPVYKVASWEKEIYTCCRDGIVRRYQLSDL